MKQLTWHKLALILCGLLLVSACDRQPPELASMQQFIDSQSIDKSKGDWNRNLKLPPKLTFNPENSYFWTLQTNLGVVKIALKPDVAPMHVSSTIYLSMLGFYDGLIFHRVIPGFMAQGGDPLGSGIGGPGYKYAGEFDPSARHDKPGILSMANAGPGTDGSQFFITFTETPHLNGRHTVFGEVTQGMDVLRRIEAQGTGSGRTLSEIKILKASIEIEKASQ